MHFSASDLKETTPRNNTLYRLWDGQEFEVIEEIDQGKDVIFCEVSLKDYDEAVFGKEYRSPFIRGNEQKRADILCIMVNDEEKKTTSYIYEIKNRVCGEDRVNQVIEQLIASIRQKKVMLYAAEIDRYTENAHVGLITSHVCEEEITRIINEYQKQDAALNHLSHWINKTILMKKKGKMETKKPEIRALKDFMNGIIRFNEKEVYNLEILKLEQVDQHYECHICFD